MPSEADGGGERELDGLDRAVAASGIVLFASAFLPWFTYSLHGGRVFRDTSSTVAGWTAGLGWAGLPAVLGVTAAALVLLEQRGVDPVRLPLTRGQRELAIGGLAAALVTVKLLVGHHHGVYEVRRAFGIWVATLAALALATAGFLRHHREQREGRD